MTRKGKIARLPREIRELLNHRLEDGEPGVTLVEWLNSQRKVRSVLKAEFGGNPINEQNLTEWKQGGFVEWQQHQDMLVQARELAANAGELDKACDGSLADRVSSMLAVRYAALLGTLQSATGERVDDWKMLREVCSDLTALRKGDHSAARVQIQRYKC
jgi:hypothetical protein